MIKANKNDFKPASIASSPSEGPTIASSIILAGAGNFPDFKIFARSFASLTEKYPVIEEGKNKGIIGVGGLMLARIPTETVQERTEYFREQTRNQMTAVDENLMREQHPSMPIHKPDRQSRVTFGGKEKLSE